MTCLGGGVGKASAYAEAVPKGGDDILSSNRRDRQSQTRCLDEYRGGRCQSVDMTRIPAGRIISAELSSNLIVPPFNVAESMRKLKSGPNFRITPPLIFYITLANSLKLPNCEYTLPSTLSLTATMPPPHYDDLLFSPRLIDHVERARDLPSRVDPGPPLAMLERAPSAGLCACQRFCLII